MIKLPVDGIFAVELSCPAGCIRFAAASARDAKQSSSGIIRELFRQNIT
ncbi:hypothetical protein [uncultured Clostridium sp.]|nr:hypothetical protein [uncultured Clostridium sp.]